MTSHNFSLKGQNSPERALPPLPAFYWQKQKLKHLAILRCLPGKFHWGYLVLKATGTAFIIWGGGLNLQCCCFLVSLFLKPGVVPPQGYGNIWFVYSWLYSLDLSIHGAMLRITYIVLISYFEQGDKRGSQGVQTVYCSTWSAAAGWCFRCLPPSCLSNWISGTVVLLVGGKEAALRSLSENWAPSVMGIFSACIMKKERRKQNQITFISPHGRHLLISAQFILVIFVPFIIELGFLLLTIKR